MKKIMRAQLTKQLSVLQAAPQGGWVKLIRQALCMSTRQLAKRLHVSQSRISQIERNEASQVLSLKALNDVAEALGCQLCYSLVPRKDLESMMHEQAEKKAKAYLKTVGYSMALESQGTSTESQKLILEEAIARILEKPHLLWDENKNEN
jgi:predicted DNA-binding mobile mystery protein A